MPLAEYQEDYKATFAKYDLAMVFLVTPQPSDERIRLLDSESRGFLYAVSSASTTGKGEGFGEAHRSYLERLQKLKLKNPILVGFGISNAEDVAFVSQYTNGAIIGSAFLRAITNQPNPAEAAKAFVSGILEPLQQQQSTQS